MEVAGLEHLLRKRGFLNKGWLHRLEVHRASSLLASHRFVHSLCEYGGATRLGRIPFVNRDTPICATDSKGVN